ncbi:MAG: maleylpyruvate isomerase N-terminal domain-containing protein [Acidimicrobiales bacterium]
MDRSPLPADVGKMVAGELELWRQIVAGVSDTELVRPSGCAGWSVADLLCHVRADGEALLQSLATSCDDAPDRDYVTYWSDWPASGEPTFADVRWRWATTAAYATATGLRQHFEDVLSAAAAGARKAAPGRTRFQGHVLSTDDLLAMWATELAIHHLDLLVALPDRYLPDARALAVAAQTVDSLLGRGRVAGWEDATYLQKATGRAALEPAEVAALGEHAARLPVFG